VRHAIDSARAAGIPIVVDPKRRSFAAYRGATVVTPNLHELEAHSHGVVPFELGTRRRQRAVRDRRRRAAGHPQLRRNDTVSRRSGALHVAALAKEVFDVTGAGDTVVATIALALAARVPIEAAVRAASLAAADQFSKRGTRRSARPELVSAIDAAPG